MSFLSGTLRSGRALLLDRLSMQRAETFVPSFEGFLKTLMTRPKVPWVTPPFVLKAGDRRTRVVCGMSLAETLCPAATDLVCGPQCPHITVACRVAAAPPANCVATPFLLAVWRAAGASVPVLVRIVAPSPLRFETAPTVATTITSTLLSTFSSAALPGLLARDAPSLVLCWCLMVQEELFRLATSPGT